jgi:hypothetical protein
MATADTKSREAPRYELVDERQVQLELEPDDLHSEPSTVMARLLNLSTQGAKLAVPLDPPRNWTIRMKLAIDELGVSFYLSTRVCWSAPAGDGGYLIGCQLSPAVPETVLRHVAGGARPERREDDRRPTTHQIAVIRKSFFRTREETGVLRNFATGGVCIEVGGGAKLGEVINLRLGEATEIPAIEVVVRWTLQEGDRYLWGCEYADPGSFAMLASLLK